MENSYGGQFKKADFFDLTGGLNLSDSPFNMADNQPTGGANYDYSKTGAITKRGGHDKVNTVADSQLRTLGLGIRIDSTNAKQIFRAAGTKFQAYDGVSTFTALTQDDAGLRTDIISPGTTTPVVFTQFNNPDNNVLWSAGGEIGGRIVGIYSGTKWTLNGVEVPTGAISATPAGVGGVIPAGLYDYAVSYVKTSTGAESNCVLDARVTVAAGNKVTIDLTGLTSLDTAHIGHINIYRSQVASTVFPDGFTAGSLVATVTSATTSYVDDGSADIDPSTTVPRAGNTLNDKTILDGSGGKVYNTIASFKRHLVTSQGNTLVFSSPDEQESWPTLSNIPLPTGGYITGLATISASTPTSTALDEYLVVFQERSMWIVVGETINDFSLRYVDAVGCANQSLIVNANGHLFWIDYSGIWMWSGSGKPVHMSRTLQSLFDANGTIDKTKMSIGWGAYYRKKRQVIWFLSDTISGVQKYSIKLDLKLTLPQAQTNLVVQAIDGVFIQDTSPVMMTAGISFIPTSSYEEYFLGGDNTGFMYTLLSAFADVGSNIDFSYETKFLDFGSKGQAKRYQKIIVWVQDTSDAELYLDWWTGYTYENSEASTLHQKASQKVSLAEWDIAFWDSADWDAAQGQSYNAVVFNLSSAVGNTEGDCLKLRFRQSDADAPIIIAGYSVIYTDLAVRK